jgi:NAD(P)H dehydrogenase (quinone)
MKYLIIFAHPFAQSLNGHLKEAVCKHLSDNQHEVIVRNLYQLDFNPILSSKEIEGQRMGKVGEDVSTEQEYILWAEILILIHPIWWTGLPAILKGYIERVFSYGFAYQYDQGIQQGLLAGKQAIIINTQGKSGKEYQDSGMDKALSLTSDQGIYTYCGMTVKHHFFFEKADRANPEIIGQWIKEITSIL